MARVLKVGLMKTKAILLKQFHKKMIFMKGTIMKLNLLQPGEMPFLSVKKGKYTARNTEGALMPRGGPAMAPAMPGITQCLTGMNASSVPTTSGIAGASASAYTTNATARAKTTSGTVNGLHTNGAFGVKVSRFQKYKT